MPKIDKSDINNFSEFEKYCQLIENSVFYNKTRETNQSEKKGNCFDGEVELYQFIKNFYKALHFISSLGGDTAAKKDSKVFKDFILLLKLFFGYDDDSEKYINDIYYLFFINNLGIKGGDEIFEEFNRTIFNNTFCFLTGTKTGKVTYGATTLTPTSNIRENNTNTSIDYNNYNLESIYWYNKDNSNKNPTSGLYGITSGIKFIPLIATINSLKQNDPNELKNVNITHISKYNPVLSYKNVKSNNLSDACFPFDNYILIDNFFPDPTKNEKWENTFWDYFNSIKNINAINKKAYYYNADNNNIVLLKNTNMKSIPKYNEDSDIDYDKISIAELNKITAPAIQVGSFIEPHSISTSENLSNITSKLSSHVVIENKSVLENRTDLVFSYITNFLNIHLWNKIDLKNVQQVEKIIDCQFNIDNFRKMSTDTQEITGATMARLNFGVDANIKKLSDILDSYNPKDNSNISLLNRYTNENPEEAQIYSMLRYGILTTRYSSLAQSLSSNEFKYTEFNRNQLACMLLLARSLYKNDYNWSQYIKEEYGITTESQGFNLGTTTYSLNIVGVEKPYEKVVRDSLTQKLMNPLYSVYKNSDEKNLQDKIIEKIKQALYGYEFDFDKRSELIIPINVNMSIDGISGLRINDAIELDFLPDIYKNNIVLSINNISHDITNEWKTDLQLIIRTKIKS